MRHQIYNWSRGEYCDLLKDYALSGLKYYNSVSENFKTRVMRHLHNKIESDEWNIRRQFNSISRGQDEIFGFLPMPKPSGNDFSLGFFIPKFRHMEKQKFLCSYDIMLWIDNDENGSVDQIRRGKTIAFRLEPADQDSSPHAYPHIQISRAIRAPAIRTSVPKWVPESYPAFPMGLASPVGFFAAVVTSVHGYSKSEKDKYAPKILREAMSQGKAANRAPKILDEIDRLLG